MPFIQLADQIDASVLTPDLIDATLDASFERYFARASMLGLIEKCMEVVEHFEVLTKEVAVG